MSIQITLIKFVWTYKSVFSAAIEALYSAFTHLET